MLNKNVLLQSLVVILLFINILGLDLSGEEIWSSNQTQMLSLFVTLILLVALLLKEAPPKEKSARPKGHFNKRK